MNADMKWLDNPEVFIFFFQSHDVTKPEHYTVLKQRLEELDKQFGAEGIRLMLWKADLQKILMRLL